MGQKKHKIERQAEKIVSQQKKAQQKSIQKIALFILIAAVLITGIVLWATLSGSGDSNDPSASPSPSAAAEQPKDEASGDFKLPPASLAENKDWNAQIDLNGEKVGVELFGDKAPQAVANFIQLTRDDYWAKKDTSCPRITTAEGFKVLQCGAPGGDQAGGPSYNFGPVENAPADELYPEGTLAMARAAAADSQGSQFFIVYGDTKIPAGDAGGYTIFGKVTSGIDVIKKFGEAGSDNKNGEGDGAPKVGLIKQLATISE